MEELSKLEQGREQNSEFVPVRSLSTYWRLDYGYQSSESEEELIARFQEVPEVELAYREFITGAPAIDASDDDHAELQEYLEAAPVGVNAHWAWLQEKDGEKIGTGAGAGLVVLEEGWIPAHEDLTNVPASTIANHNRYLTHRSKGDHGTASLGIVVGIDNDLGIVGIAPDADYVKMTSRFDERTGDDGLVADAIAAALLVMRAGDILLLEVERIIWGERFPIEIDDAIYDAILLASALGIIVIEPAGNGGKELDTAVRPDNTDHGRVFAPGARDSGAIMVGASELGYLSAAPIPFHRRWEDSNYGTRVDCFSWGKDITTAGYAGRADSDHLFGRPFNT